MRSGLDESLKWVKKSPESVKKTNSMHCSFFSVNGLFVPAYLYSQILQNFVVRKTLHDMYRWYNTLCIKN
jgi:hypothetical protein